MTETRSLGNSAEHEASLIADLPCKKQTLFRNASEINSAGRPYPSYCNLGFIVHARQKL